MNKITFHSKATNLLHLIENTFDQKRIYASPSSNPNPNFNSSPNPNPKAQ